MFATTVAKEFGMLRNFTITPKHFSHCASVSFVLIIIRIQIQKYICPIVPGLVVVRNYTIPTNTNYGRPERK